MHITITGVHIEITEAIREYAHDRFNALAKYAPKGEHTSNALSFEITKTTAHHTHGDIFQAEARMHVKGKELHVRTVGADVYALIDETRDKLTRELTEYKDKQLSVFKRGAYKIKKLLRLQKD